MENAPSIQERVYNTIAILQNEKEQRKIVPSNVLLMELHHTLADIPLDKLRKIINELCRQKLIDWDICINDYSFTIPN